MVVDDINVTEKEGDDKNTEQIVVGNDKMAESVLENANQGGENVGKINDGQNAEEVQMNNIEKLEDHVHKEGKQVVVQSHGGESMIMGKSGNEIEIITEGIVELVPDGLAQGVDDSEKSPIIAEKQAEIVLVHSETNEDKNASNKKSGGKNNKNKRGGGSNSGGGKRR